MKLKTVKVPWWISPSVEIAEFEYDINSSYVYITVVCNLSNSEWQRRIDEYIEKNGEIPENVENSIGMELVKLKFDGLCLLNIVDLPESDFFQIEKRYDFSLVPNCIGKHFHEMWDKEGNCPDPGMYTVIDSKYFDFFNINTSDFTHWLITIGTTAQEVHVIAKKFSWEFVD